MMLVGAFCFPWLFLAVFQEIPICESSEALALRCQASWRKLGTTGKLLDAKHFHHRRPDTTPLVGSAHSKPACITCVTFKRHESPVAAGWVVSPEVWIRWPLTSVISVVNTSCTCRKSYDRARRWDPELPSLSGKTAGLPSQLEIIVSILPPVGQWGGRGGGNGLKRAYFSDPTPGVLQTAGTRGFPSDHGQPAEPCLEMLMARPLVWRILLVWKSSQEKMLLVRPLNVLAIFLHPEAVRAGSQSQR